LEGEPVEELVVVDVRDRRRLGEYAELIERAERIVIFDHHRSSEHDLSADESFVEPVGACVTLLCERIEKGGVEIDEAEATLAMLGLYADTGSLSFDSTTARDIEAAAFLRRNGARLSVVNRYMQQRFSPEQRELLVTMMPRTDTITVDAVDVAIATTTTPKYVRSAAEVVSDIMNLGGHDAMFGIIGFEKGDRVQVVGRSRVPYVDVGRILSQMGGGGHQGAAAASFKGRSVEEVLEELEAVLDRADLRPTRISDLMTSPVETIPRDIPLAEARRLLERWGVSGAPVLRDGELEGILSARDIERAADADKLDLPVASHMSHEPVVIAPDEPVEDALEVMTEHDIGRMPVCDSSGRMIGIVSRTDILERLYRDRT
ncbi:MAG: CBS domain-containing protein, partial [Persicimonas sp.]